MMIVGDMTGSKWYVVYHVSLGGGGGRTVTGLNDLRKLLVIKCLYRGRNQSK